MAFTETTFSLLRESVKQSMQEDKQKGLPTGELLESKPDTFGINTRLKDVFTDVRYITYAGGFITAYNWVMDNLELSDGKISAGNITLTVTLKKGEKPVTKKGIKLGKALKWVFPEAKDRVIKDKVACTTSKYTTRYVLFTDRYIHKHYRVLSNTQDLKSCMSKHPEYYGIIRPGTTTSNPPWERYIYPTEPYNGSPNLRLALISKHHPDSKEFNKEGQYPFIARAIVKVGEDGISYGRVYGIENARTILADVGIKNEGTEGGKLNIMYSVYNDIVAPYVDPHNSLNNDGDHLIIDEYGEYEIEHNRGILETKYKGYYCDHCEEYHEYVDEDDYIYVDGVGSVYGHCQDNYEIPYGRGEYYLTEDLYFSEYHDSYLHPDDAVGYIKSISGRFGVEVDYIHEDDVDDICKLTVTYECYDYAHEDICVITEDGDVFIEGYQDDLYFEFEDKLYTLSKAVWSKAMGQYIPNSLAYLYFGDYYTKEYIEENFTDPEEPEETEELNDAA